MTCFITFGCEAGQSRSVGPAEEQTARTSEALFTNGDFEAGTLNGWTVTTGLNNGIPALTFPPTRFAELGFAAGGNNLTSAVNASTTGSPVPNGLVAADSLRFPFLGADSAVVNERGRNKNANIFRQNALMTASDVDAADGRIHLRFAVAPVLHNPTHAMRLQPYFFIELNNVTTGQQLFNTFNFSNQPGVPWKTGAQMIDVGNGPEPVLYTEWQAFDVAPLGGALNIGDTVQVTVVAAGCQPNGHFGEIYLDQFATAFPLPNVNVSAPAYATGNSDITYTVTVKNGGGAASTNTTVNFTTPTLTDSTSPTPQRAQLAFVSTSTPGFTCSQPLPGAVGTVSCNIGTLGAGNSYTYTVTVHIPTIPGGYVAPDYVNAGTYSVVSDQTSVLTGNLIQTRITNSTPVDLTATLTDGKVSMAWGQADTYTLVVKNNGPSAVTGAVITAPLPAGFTGTTWTCTGSVGGVCGAASGTNAPNTTANLAVGASVTYTINTTVNGGPGAGKVVYTATATPPTGFVQAVAFDNTATDVNSNDSTLYTLTVNKDAAGSGKGTVVVYPGGYTCDTGCTTTSALYANNSSIALTATTAAGAAFEGWTGGGCVGVTNPCVTTVTANATVAAKFDTLSLATAIAATSNGNASSVRPGDTVDYSVKLTIPNNFAWPVQVKDTLPTGLNFLNLTTATTTGTLTCAVGSCATPVVTGIATKTMDFGNVTCTTPAGCTIEFNVHAQVAATAVRTGAAVNTIGASYVADQQVAVAVIEPNLTMTRTATPASGVSVGQVSTVTVTLANNTGGADAAAYLGVVSLPTLTDLNYGNYQPGTCPVATPALTSSPATFTFPSSTASLAAGATCSFSYDVTVGTAASGNTGLISLPGTFTGQSIAGTAPPAKTYTVSDVGVTVTTAPFPNGQSCTVAGNCASNVCDTDGKCGYADGDGPCALANGSTVCRSGACLYTLVCGVPGCLVDADCTSTQFCNTATATCSPKLPNGTSIPTITGHTPDLAGTCTSAVGAAVCASGVCDTADSKCGYANGDGPCAAANGITLCRSGTCLSTFVCGTPTSGCATDAECTATQFCNTATATCLPKLPNGTSIPTVTGHTPDLAGTCTSAVGAAVCASGVCDTADSKCGYANGDGPCAAATGITLCRSGTCLSTLVCGTPTSGCATDSECTTSQFCDTQQQVCNSKLPNGTSIPTITGHTPRLTGTCSLAVAAAVCVSSICDAKDNRCGLADSDGPCTQANRAVVCRSGVCSADGVCGTTSGCRNNADCAGGEICDAKTKACRANAEMTLEGGGFGCRLAQGSNPSNRSLGFLFLGGLGAAIRRRTRRRRAN